jgi:hypothetical protein
MSRTLFRLDFRSEPADEPAGAEPRFIGGEIRALRKAR